MNKDNNFGRLLLLLLLAFGICLGLYYLPDQLFGMKIKKVDLLSDLRIKPESLSMDSLRMQLEQPDTVRIDSAAVRDSILKTTGIDSVALALRDSLYKVMYADKGADSLGTRIEDILHFMPKSAENGLQAVVTRSPLLVQAVMLAIAIFVVVQFKSAGVQPFIYFQF